MTTSLLRRLGAWFGRGAVSVALMLGVALSHGGMARADEGRPVGWAMHDTTAQVRLGPVTVHYQPELAEQAQAVSAAIPTWWHDIENKLGTDVSDELDVYVVSHAGRVAQATGMPTWAAGVAHSASGKVIVALHDPSGAPSDLESLTRHELAHVALHRAVGGNWIPRWFNEGVADGLGEEIDFGRAQTMAQAVFGGGVPERSVWNAAFRGDAPQRVSEIYAVSRDFARFLRYYQVPNQGESAAFKALIDRLEHGVGFNAAVEQSYGQSLDQLENHWRAGLSGRFFWYPMLSSGDWSFAALMPMLVFAYWRRRRNFRRGLARLAAQETQEDAQEAAQEQAVAAMARHFAGSSPRFAGALHSR